jgi:ubiquinone/menaquinone biosynthesis C-methylase UbiE/predicted NUDIX family NTP pyrophosphohydrolase
MPSPTHSNKVKRLFDARAASYDGYTVWRNDQRLFSEILRPLDTLDKNAYCLDLGGGTGRVAHYGSRIAGRWIIADLSLEMLRSSRDSLPAVNADAMLLPMHDAAFDFVVALSAVSYADISRVFSEMHRVTRNDGVVVIAEKVVGDFLGVAQDWYRAVQRLRNPLKVEVLETAQVTALLAAAGFNIESSIELRTLYRQDYRRWLSRNGVLPSDIQHKLDKLVKERPVEVKEIGFDLDSGILSTPVSWTICTAQKVKPRTNRPIVITIAPVRRKEQGLQIYVQHRNAPVLEEPDFLGSYEFPQGHMDISESVEEAARRELAEEAGLTVRKVLKGEYISRTHSDGLVQVESTNPELVVITSGRLQQIALLFIVEAANGSQTAAIDNRGSWKSVEEFKAVCSSNDIYPLNVPMFSYIMRNLDTITAQLLESRDT